MLYQQNCLLYSYPIQRFYLFSESRLAATHHQNALMSFVKVWVHAVWGTKHREPVLIKEKRDVLFRHIKDNALSKNVYIDCINGHLDHVHCLFELNAEIPLAKTLQLLKGEASHWANKQNLFGRELDWANGYFAVSVSESVVEKVRAYINQQEEHHQKVTFQEEYELFLQKYGLRKDKQRHP
jgi:REP element-mobilizing transposase RayT